MNSKVIVYLHELHITLTEVFFVSLGTLPQDMYKNFVAYTLIVHDLCPILAKHEDNQ